MFLRNTCLILLISFGFIPAFAQGAGNGTSGGTVVNVGPNSGGGGFVSGTVPYHELGNIGMGNVDIPNDLLNVFNTIRSSQQSQKKPGTGSGVVKATNSAVDILNCKLGGKYKVQEPPCPLWYNILKTDKTTSTPGIYNKIHYRSISDKDSPSAITSGVPIAFNLKIWRENKATKRFNLIFQRRVSVPTAAQQQAYKRQRVKDYRTTAPLFPYSAADMQRRMNWWQGYTGRNYWVSGAAKAGPFGGLNSNSQMACRKNWWSGENGERLNTSGKIAESYIRPKNGVPAPAGENWCYWEGAEINSATPFRWGLTGTNTNTAGAKAYAQHYGRPNGLPDDQFGSGRNGIRNKGLKEAVLFRWSLDNYKQNGGRPYFNLQIDGAPGLFYMGVVTMIDARQEIIPLSNNDDKFTVRNGQSIKVWTATPTSTPPGCPKTNPYYPTCEPPEPEPYVPSIPAATIELETESPVQTRETSQQTVAFSVDPLANDFDYGEDQALFPYESELIHYTPQLRFSSLQGVSKSGSKTYGTNYIQYAGGEPHQVNATVVNRNSTDRNKIFIPDNSTDQVQMNVITQAPTVSMDADGFVNNFSEATYDFTWLQPTLDNPCPNPGSYAFGYTNGSGSGIDVGWPDNLQKCETDSLDLMAETYKNPQTRDQYQAPVDVWNDVLSASGSWEARWVERLRNPNIPAETAGYIQNQRLRCGWSYLASTPADNCPQPFLGLVPYGGTEQTAQASVALATNNNSNKAPLRIIMDTNFRNGSDGNISATLQRRSNGEEIPNNANSLLNSRTRKNEFNYCLQGIPYNSDGTAALIYKPGAIIERDSSYTGDSNCRGYAVSWQWDQSADSCYKVTNMANFNSRLRTRYNNSWQASTSPAYHLPPAGYSRYNVVGNDIGGDKGRAYASSGMANNSAPVLGKMPGIRQVGNKTEYNYISCGTDKYYVRGQWVIRNNEESKADAGWGPNNSGNRIFIGDADDAEDSNVFIANFNFDTQLGSIEAPPSGFNNSFNANPENIGPGDLCPKFQGTNPRYCWSIRASYEGYTNKVWYRKWNRVEPFTAALGNQPTSTDYIQVYGPKASR